jgi:outer membrane protein
MKKKLLAGMLLLCSMAAMAQGTKTTTTTTKWKARLRAITVMPPSSSYDMGGGTNVTISTAVVPELDFTYYFTRNLSAELILGTTRHTVKAESSTTTTNLGKVWLLPPTLNVQYHLPLKGFEPYIGAGVNYTIFYGVKDEAATLGYKNKFGFSTQLGFDYDLSSKWFLNVDVKRLWLKTDVSVKGTTTVLNDVKINPFIIGVGIGTRF